MTPSLNNECADKSAHDSVLSTYNEEETAQFYQVIMGDGGGQLHYGIYKNGTESFIEAADNSIQLLLNLLQQYGGIKVGQSTRILDAGAGNGGSAHQVCKQTGTSVTCVNLCTTQNELNEQIVKEMGLSDKISVHTGSFDDYPREWTNSFDAIWSQDAYLHGPDKHRILQENYRVLKHGGFVVMSDIMASPYASKENLRVIINRLHLDYLLTLDEWIEKAEKAGFQVVATRDLTSHLKHNYARMAARAVSERHRMDKCSEDFLDQYTASLKKNAAMLAAGEAQTWNALLLKKID